MKQALLRLFGLITLVLAGIATGSAQCDPIKLGTGEHCMELVDVGSRYAMGGVYASPYGVTVDGVRELLICDDFITDVSLHQRWKAAETSLTELRDHTNPASTPKFPNITPGVIENYSTAAILAGWLMSEPTFKSAKAAELSFAIWAIFDPTLLNKLVNGKYINDYGYLTVDQRNTAQGFLDSARDIAKRGDINSIPQLTIYTPIPGGASQEFLKVSIAMPEPSAIALLAVDLMGIVGLILFVHRRGTGKVAN